MHPESLPACLEPGPHRLLSVHCTFAQRHPLLQTCLWKEALFSLQDGLFQMLPELLSDGIPMGLCGLAQCTYLQCSPCYCPISQHLEATQWLLLDPQPTASSGPDGLRVWGGPVCTHWTLLVCLWSSQKTAGQGGISAVWGDTLTLTCEHMRKHRECGGEDPEIRRPLQDGRRQMVLQTSD